MTLELQQLNMLTEDEALRLKCVELATRGTNNPVVLTAVAKSIYEYVRPKQGNEKLYNCSNGTPSEKEAVTLQTVD